MYEVVGERAEIEKEAEKLKLCDLAAKQIKVDKLREKKKTVFLGEFAPEEVLAHISKEETKKVYTVNGQDYLVRMNSHRYFVFRESLSCVACGIQGTKMILEHNPADKSPHFNLYAIENGELILMTKDHVRPKALGGGEYHSNLQPMCAICNNLKGSANLTLEAIAELRKLYNENSFLSKNKLKELLKEAKNRLSGEAKYPPVSKYTRRLCLAEVKSRGLLIANTDIHVWRADEGYIGRSVYESLMKNADLVACVKHGTKLEAVDYRNSKIVVKLEDIDVAIYHGHLSVC